MWDPQLQEDKIDSRCPFRWIGTQEVPVGWLRKDWLTGQWGIRLQVLDLSYLHLSKGTRESKMKLQERGYHHKYKHRPNDLGMRIMNILLRIYYANIRPRISRMILISWTLYF